jgi:hypothetical protein
VELKLKPNPNPLKRDPVAHSHTFLELILRDVRIALRLITDKRRVQDSEATLVEIDTDDPDTGLSWCHDGIRERAKFGRAET